MRYFGVSLLKNREWNWVVWSVIRSFIYSVLLIPIATYSLYVYSWNNGIRIPFEGIEPQSILLSLMGFVGFMLPVLINIIAKYSALSSRAAVQFVVNESGFRISAIKSSLFLKLIFTVIFIFMWWQLTSEIKETHCGLVRKSLNAFYLIFLLTLTSGFIYNLYKKYINMTLFLIQTIILVFLATIIFSEEKYALFLKMINYGGHIPTSVGIINQATTHSGKLVLRTKSYIFLYANNLITEYNVQNTNTISYNKAIHEVNFDFQVHLCNPRKE